MAKAKVSKRKPAETGVDGSKRKTIMEFIDLLTVNKTKWEALSEFDKKTFDPFIVNRFLSMNPYLITLANEIQKTFNIGDKMIMWKAYFEILPSQKIYLNYIKAKAMIELSAEEERIVTAIVFFFKCTRTEAIQYWELFKKTEQGRQELQEMISSIANK